MILYTNADCFGYSSIPKIKINSSLGYTSKIMTKRVTRLRGQALRHSSWVDCGAQRLKKGKIANYPPNAQYESTPLGLMPLAYSSF